MRKAMQVADSMHIKHAVFAAWKYVLAILQEPASASS
jgi:hypothetical protein